MKCSMRIETALGLLLLMPAVAAWGATRAEYAEIIERGTDAASVSQLRVLSRAQGRAVSRFTVAYGLAEAFLARHHGRRDRAARAKKVLAAVGNCVLEGSEGQRVVQFLQMEFCLYPAALSYVWLRDLGELNAAETERARRMLTACADGVLKHCPERGAMNRVPWAGLGPAAVARLFPDSPRAPAWLDYSEKTWNDWWAFRDTFEDASGYNGLWLLGVFLQADQMNRTNDLKTPEVEALVERFAQLCSPVGLIPDYGDAMWSGGWAHWVAVFERGASLSGRADFKHAADAIFRYAQAQFSRGSVTKNPQEIAALVFAWLWANDELKPQRRPLRSLVTKRRDPYGRTLLDKLVLRGGADSDDAYVLVNLHDCGYHGHADGGALSAFIANGSVLLHELGYHQSEEQHHNTLLVRPADEEFLFTDGLFCAGRWYTTEMDLRRPFTYTGGVIPDLKKIDSIFFRLDDKDDSNTQFEFAVDRIEGVGADGRRSALVDFSLPEEPGRWKGCRPSQSAKGGGLFASVGFRDKNRSERAWLTRPFDPPLDLSPYERIRVRWRSGDARLDPKLGVQFGLNGIEGTERWRISHRRTYRETLSAELQEFGRVVHAKLTEKMVDCLGRPLVHTREFALVRKSKLLCVYDCVQFEVRGEYAVGPVWHVQNIIKARNGEFLCRDDQQWDDLTVRWASPPRPVRIRLAGPPGTTFERVEKEFKEWGRTVPQHNHIYARWVGTAERGRTVTFISVLMPLSAESRKPLPDLRVTVSEKRGEVRFGGARCCFGSATIPKGVAAGEVADFLYLEEEADRPCYAAGMVQREPGAEARFEWRAKDS